MFCFVDLVKILHSKSGSSSNNNADVLQKYKATGVVLAGVQSLNFNQFNLKYSS